MSVDASKFFDGRYKSFQYGEVSHFSAVLQGTKLNLRQNDKCVGNYVVAQDVVTDEANGTSALLSESI